MRKNLINSGIDENREEKVPGKSGQCFRLKLENNFSPSRETANLELSELIDVKAIQPLMDDFYKLTHIPIGLNDLKGNVLGGSGWQDICTKFHRAHPEACKHCVESNIELSSGVIPGEFKLYKCKNNMWDIVTPIMVGDQHVGYVFAGQFFFDDEPLDYELFRFQARKYGFNEEEYIAALQKVPRFSRKAVETGMGFFITFASMLSQLSYSNIKLAQLLAERDTLVEALQKNREDFDRAQIVGNIGSWRLDVRKNELKWSDENHRIFGIPKGIPLTYETFLSIVHPDDREYVDNEWKTGLEGKPYDIEHRIIVDDKIKWVREKAYLEFDKVGTVIGGFGITQDITELKKVEEKLRLAGKYNRSLIEASLDPLVTIGPDGKITDVNSSTETVTGFSREELIGTDFSDYFTEPEKAKDGYQHVFQEGLVRDYPLEIQHKEGRITPVLYNASVYKDEKGKVIGVFAAAHDITEVKKVEEILKLKAGEIARKKEIHHRIKNNLQVISSLLDLQAEKFGSREFVEISEVLEAFRESQDRVASIALIHEELYEGEENNALNFTKYLEKLVENLFQTYRFGNINLSLNMDLEENVFFDMDIAVPLGIIVNELVSNSLKHAFPNREEGNISIRLHRQENSGEEIKKNYTGREKDGKINEFTLIVSDNGIGIPETLDIENSDTLGLQLVSILIDQLKGRLELRRDNGTEFIIEISKERDDKNICK